jgi:hypothetical protein
MRAHARAFGKIILGIEAHQKKRSARSRPHNSIAHYDITPVGHPDGLMEICSAMSTVKPSRDLNSAMASMTARMTIGVELELPRFGGHP